MATSRPSALAVRLSRPASPTTSAGAGRPSANSLAQISGPIPHGSPIVMAIGLFMRRFLCRLQQTWPGSSSGLWIHASLIVLVDALHQVIAIDHRRVFRVLSRGHAGRKDGNGGAQGWIE